VSLAPDPKHDADLQNSETAPVHGSDHPPQAGWKHRPIATIEIEQILCNPYSPNTISGLMRPSEDAWRIEFPDLTSLPRAAGKAGPLSVCIATEDIVGPVRNGGIGTTYAALAEMLAAEGHDTTILYLRGQEVETGSLEQWIDHYAARGVKFVPVPNYAQRDGFQSGADRWLRAPYNMLRYLINHPMDVVHVSEWRGSGYLSLLAKRQGLAFKDTLFIVKTSSPWLWNRLYGSQPLERIEDLAKIYAERRSVELADMVIGGSLHLLRWMSSQGYQLPRTQTFVQPNFVNFDHLRSLIGRRNTPPGTRMPINELVFFGRLEARKGLFTFCQSIRRLMREGVKLPPKISFMGKPGAKLPGRAHQSVIEYIEAETANWPVEVQILTEFQQQQAIEYLLGDSRLAIMPSAIENSSMAVYEAAICGIPFIGSGVGGSPELVRPEDHPHVFCDPHPIPLAEQIKVAIAEGGYIATPSFDNDENVAVWKRFHADLAKGLREQLRQKGNAHGERAPDASVAICIYHSGNLDALRQTLQTLEAQSAKPDEVLIAVDAPNAGALVDAQAVTAASTLPCRLIETFDEDVGLSFNSLADAAASDLALFVWEGTTLDPQAISVLRKVMMLSGADVLNFFYRHIDAANPPPADAPHPLKAIVVGSVSEAFFRKELTAQPLFVKRSAFREIGGFSTDYRVLGYDSEFLAKAQLSSLQCETALMELASVPAFAKEWLHELCYDEGLSQFRAIRPQLAAAPLALRDLLLMAKGMSARGGVAAPKKRAETAKSQSNFERMLSAFGADAIEVAPKPKAEPSRTAKPARPAQRRSVVSLIDVLEQTLGKETRDSEARPANKKKANGKAESTAYEIPAPAREPLERRLFYVRDGAVYGAVLDRTQPDRKLVVEALKDGKVIATTTADLTHAMPQRAHRPEFDGHGFVLRPFSTWMPQSLNRGSMALDLRVAGDNVMLARDLRIYGPGATMAGTPFDGYCEPSREGLLQGWVWLESDPDRRMDIAIFVDGKFAIRLRADGYREDLVQNQIGSGEHAFRISVDKLVSDGDPHVVEVVIAQNGLRLKRSPLVVTGRIVKPGASARFPFGQRARATLTGMFGGRN
jgi:glycosyltransferase involved in cell wall biosynthesis